MESDSLEADIKEFVARKMAVRPDQLALEIRLLQDIGVDGDDGCELMEEFGKRFGVGLDQFRPGLHFRPEGDGFANFLLGLFRVRPARFIPIMIGDLITAARSGRWVTPTREPI